jgi:Fur family ferric uptake transcriptional regulator
MVMSQRRNTPQRKTIESFLEQSTSPILPKELHQQAQQSLPHLGIATVFRALKDLVAEGKARVVEIPGDAPRYESIKRKHHHHFKCNGCEQVFCIEGCPGNLETLLNPGFQLTDHDITLFGTCSNCS